MIPILCEGFNPANSVIPLTFTKSFSKTERVKLTVSYSGNFDLFDSCVQVTSNIMGSTAPPSTISTSLVDPADVVLLGGLMLNPGLLLAPIGAAVVAACTVTLIYLSNLDTTASDGTTDPDDQYYIDEDDPVILPTRKNISESSD